MAIPTTLKGLDDPTLLELITETGPLFFIGMYSNEPNIALKGLALYAASQEEQNN